MSTDLLTWAEHYLRARDAFERKMLSLERSEEKLAVTYKNRSVIVLAKNKLDTDVSAQGLVTIVTLQNQVNFKTLVDNFSTFAKNPDLTIIFVNPKQNEKWIIKPYTHAAVADKDSLKTGLQAMFDTVSVV